MITLQQMLFTILGGMVFVVGAGLLLAGVFTYFDGQDPSAPLSQSREYFKHGAILALVGAMILLLNFGVL